jgi:predicted transcriptional regulator
LQSDLGRAGKQQAELAGAGGQEVENLGRNLSMIVQVVGIISAQSWKSAGIGGR